MQPQLTIERRASRAQCLLVPRVGRGDCVYSFDGATPVRSRVAGYRPSSGVPPEHIRKSPARGQVGAPKWKRPHETVAPGKPGVSGVRPAVARLPPGRWHPCQHLRGELPSSSPPTGPNNTTGRFPRHDTLPPTHPFCRGGGTGRQPDGAGRPARTRGFSGCAVGALHPHVWDRRCTGPGGPAGPASTHVSPPP